MFASNPPPVRHAFVLGNGEYHHAPKLPNTIHDARNISAELRRLNFNVTEFADLDRENIYRHLEDFFNRLKDAPKCDAILFYYAGHGIQLNNDNYIVPVDFDSTAAHPILDLHAIKPIIDRMALYAEKKFIFLDACRNNGGLRPPQARELDDVIDDCETASAHPRAPISAASRSLITDTGLKREVPRHDQTFISFAADPGAEASDGVTEGMSPYTSAIVKHIGTRGLDIFDMCQRVSKDVRKSTNHSQVPWSNSNLLDKFEFNPADNKPIWIMATLGALCGIFTALISFKVLKFDNGFPIGIGDATLRNVQVNPEYLLTSLTFGLAAGFAAWKWGRRKWWIPPVTCAIYTAFAMLSRWMFAPVAAKNEEHHFLGKLTLDMLIGNGEKDQYQNIILPTTEVFLTIILTAALAGTASIASGVFASKALRESTRIGMGALVGAGAAFFLFLFLYLREYLAALGYTLFHSVDEKTASTFEAGLVIVLVACWQGALGLNLGWAYAKPYHADS